MLFQNRNLIKAAIFFATIFAYQQKCVTIAQINNPRFDDRGEIQNYTVEKYYSDKLFKNYLGCFSKNILGRMVNEMTAKVILYNPLLIQSECFNPCQKYFKEYPGSLLNLIATQHYVCVCVPNYSNQRNQLQKVPDSKCSLNITYNQDRYIAGGTRTIALYGKDENIPELHFTSGKDSEEMDDNIEIQEGIKPVGSSIIFPCKTEKCTLRIDSTGQICNDTEFLFRGDDRTSSENLAPFLNSYIPTSFENPDLCVDYCRSMNKYSIYNNGESNKKGSMRYFAIQSTVKGISYWNNTYERIELCSCSILSIMTYPLRIESCSKCPSSGLGIIRNNCTNLEFLHRVYKIELEAQRNVISSPDVDTVDSGIGNLVSKNVTPLNNEKSPEKLYKHYLGCFSRSILERMVNEIKVNYFLPKEFNYIVIQFAQDQCFRACQSFFEEKYPSRLNNVVNLIAIQDHVCNCLPNYLDDQPLKLRKIPDSNCFVLGNLVVGAPWTNSIAIYSKEKIICPENKKCEGISYGTEWLACAQETKRDKCPGLSNGTAFWTCSTEGSFDGQQPNYEDCTSQNLLAIEKKITENNLKPNTNQTKEILSDLRHFTQPNNNSKETQYFGHEIERILISLRNITKSSAQNITATFSERENITTDAIIVYGNLIATSSPWGQLPENRSKTATDLISGIEETLFSFTDATKHEILFEKHEGGKTVTPIEGDSTGFVVTLGEKKKSVQEDIKFPLDSETSITVSDNSRLPQENVQFVGIIMESKYVNQLMPPKLMESRNGENSTSNKTFDGKVISLSIRNETMNRMAIEKVVFVKFEHPVETDAVESRCTPYRRRKCAYWDTTLLVWSTYGCEKLDGQSNLTATTCKCNHLTAFAVLTDVYGNVKKQAGLEILTLILCSLSIFCLVATIVILKWADKTLKFRPNYDDGEGLTITIHLCATLILSNLLMLLLVDRHYFCLPEIACIMVGMVTHYVYLAVFGWLFVQGLLLYRRMALDGKNYINFYTIGAYCFPILPVILAAAIGYTRGDESYGSDMYCWLNGKYMWAFMGPVAVILPVNIFVMSIALRKRVKSGSPDPKLRKSSRSNNESRVLLKGFFTISVTLGLTWITGFFTLLDEPSYPFMAYVFTITNASQGIFMLVFNCILHKKIKPLLLKKIGISVEKLKGKNSSTTAQVNKTSPFVQDKPSRLPTYSNVSQADKEETAGTSDTTSEETLRNVNDESLDQGVEELFSGRELSAVLEYNSDSENDEESGTSLLSQTNNQQSSPKPRRQLTIGEESGNDDSENDNSTEGSEDEGQGPPGPAYRRKRIIGPPYLDELEESNLYLRYAGCDSEC